MWLHLGNLTFTWEILRIWNQKLHENYVRKVFTSENTGKKTARNSKEYDGLDIEKFYNGGSKINSDTLQSTCSLLTAILLCHKNIW